MSSPATRSTRSAPWCSRPATPGPSGGGHDPAGEPELHRPEAEERNDWVKRMNDLVRAMAKQEGAPVADVHGSS